MNVTSQFNEFLTNIRLTERQTEDLITGHSTLRQRLWEDADLSTILVSDFLQGSYRRHTAVKPKDGRRADVDIVVVTNLDEAHYTPHEAMDLFKPFLERHYREKWEFNNRSIGIKLSYVDLDIVLTSAPSEVVQAAVKSDTVRSIKSIGDWYELFKSSTRSQPEWKSLPLRIPDREAKCWEDTNPLEQMRKTWEKNKATNGLYINVVKALKWWRRINPEPKYPKGYPLEHLVFVTCPDTILSLAEGVTLTLEEIVDRFQVDVNNARVPDIRDHGVADHNVLARLSAEDFKEFHVLASSAAELARAALDAPTVKESCELWQKLFGGQFPDPPKQSTERSKGGYDKPEHPAEPDVERFG